MSLLAAGHILAAVVALVCGALVFLIRKGTTRHRLLGRVYVVAMVVLNLTALTLFRLFDGYGPFHVGALISLATVIPAFLAAYRKRPGWLARHYFLMSFSYVGLLAAAASEATTRLPSAPFWGAVATASLVVLVLGGAVVFARAKRTLSTVRAGSSGSS